MAEAHRDEIAKLEALYASNPEGRVFTHLAEAYRKAGETGRAHEILNEGLRRHPESASAYVVLGRVLSDGGDVEGGLTAFQRALQLDTGNLVALRWCGDLAMRAGKVEDALGYYHELIARDPSDNNLRDQVATIEADRAAAMSTPMTPAQEILSVTGADEASPAATDSYGEISLDSEPVLQPPEAPRNQGLSLEEGISLEQGLSLDYNDASDLPGDLAAWTPQTEDLPLSQSFDLADDDGAFAGEADLGSLDLGGSSDSLILGGDDMAGEDFDLSTEAKTDFSGDVISGDDLPFDPSMLDAEPLDAGSLDASPSVEASDALPFETPAWEPEPAAFEPEPAGWEPEPSVFEPETTAFEPEPAAFEPETAAFEPEAAPFEPEPLALEDEVIDPGGFTEALGGAGTELSVGMDSLSAGSAAGAVAPVTETMAELYRNQGFPDRAADVYRQLIRERGGDDRLQQKLAEVEEELMSPSAGATSDMVLDQDESGEMWLRDAESPWVSGDAAASGVHDSPYTWSGDREDSSAGAAPIASYFASLLQWRPGTEVEGSSEGDDLLLLEDDVHDAAEMPSHETPFAAPPAAAAEPMPWDSPTPAAAAFEAPPALPQPAHDPMPWDAPAATTAAPAAEQAPAPAPAPAESAAPLMPWESAPAAETPAAEEVTSAEESDEPWYNAEAGSGGGMDSADESAPQADGEDDEDLEMFRSWLQSLKK